MTNLKRYIITGANGFLGNNIIRKLSQKEDCEIRALVMPNASLKALEGLNCKIFYGDVTKKETLQDIFDKNDDIETIVIHCAAVVYIKEKYNPQVYNVNVNGTKNVAEKVLEKNAKMVYVSSVHAIPEKPNNEVMEEITDFSPNNVNGIYAKTKAETAKYVLDMVQNKGLNACIVHPSGMIGPNDYSNTHLTEMIKSISSGKLPVIVKGGYDFVDVRDVAEGVISATEKGKKGECYILSNRYYTIQELADMICQEKDLKKLSLALPIPFAKFVAPFCEMYYNLKKKTPLFTKYSLYTLSSNSNFSNKKAQKDLGYKTRDMKETIHDSLYGEIKGVAPNSIKYKKADTKSESTINIDRETSSNIYTERSEDEQER